MEELLWKALNLTIQQMQSSVLKAMQTEQHNRGDQQS